jgi:hypothetical protein
VILLSSPNAIAREDSQKEELHAGDQGSEAYHQHLCW